MPKAKEDRAKTIKRFETRIRDILSEEYADILFDIDSELRYAGLPLYIAPMKYYAHKNCCICGSRFKPKRKTQVTCGNPVCVKENGKGNV